MFYRKSLKSAEKNYFFTQNVRIDINIFENVLIDIDINIFKIVLIDIDIDISKTARENGWNLSPTNAVFEPIF